MLDHFFPLLLPKDSESLKIFDIRLREVGQKDRRTDGQTDGQTEGHFDLKKASAQRADAMKITLMRSETLSQTVRHIKGCLETFRDVFFWMFMDVLEGLGTIMDV